MIERECQEQSELQHGGVPGDEGGGGTPLLAYDMNQKSDGSISLLGTP